MNFDADIIFNEFAYLFSPDLEEGFQVFTSWTEFLELFTHHFKQDTRPLYVYRADVVEKVNVFVDASNLVVIPWDELENYL